MCEEHKIQPGIAYEYTVVSQPSATDNITIHIKPLSTMSSQIKACPITMSQGAFMEFQREQNIYESLFIANREHQKSLIREAVHASLFPQIKYVSSEVSEHTNALYSSYLDKVFQVRPQPTYDVYTEPLINAKTVLHVFNYKAFFNDFFNGLLKTNEDTHTPYVIEFFNQKFPRQLLVMTDEERAAYNIPINILYFELECSFKLKLYTLADYHKFYYFKAYLETYAYLYETNRLDDLDLFTKTLMAKYKEIVGTLNSK